MKPESKLYTGHQYVDPGDTTSAVGYVFSVSKECNNGYAYCSFDATVEFIDCNRKVMWHVSEGNDTADVEKIRKAIAVLNAAVKDLKEAEKIAKQYVTECEEYILKQESK